jgi:hypothetical protein
MVKGKLIFAEVDERFRKTYKDLQVKNGHFVSPCGAHQGVSEGGFICLVIVTHPSFFPAS